MPRQNRRRTHSSPPRAVGGHERRDDWRGVPYAVRAVTGASADKSYRCPGCDQVLRPGLPHLVVWPADDVGAEDRRHWHGACWQARERRGPGVQRSRSGPRY